MGETTPRRIQRKRTKGWKMPPNTVYVGRPSTWGNPYKVGQTNADGFSMSAFEAKERYREIASNVPIDELRGKNLACWCPLVDKDGNPVPCHADVLLEIAND